MSFSLRSLSILALLGGLAAVLAGQLAPASLALLTDTASIPSNTFTTAACFTGDTTFLDPSAEAADSGGDGDGFELDPTNAFGNNGGDAQNVDGAGDRHQFYDYNFSIASGCSIAGIEVRLDWWLSETSDDNSMSVELSWDGGTSWTASKTDTTETTVEHTAVLGSSADDGVTPGRYRSSPTRASERGSPAIARTPPRSPAARGTSSWTGCRSGCTTARNAGSAHRSAVI